MEQKLNNLTNPEEIKEHEKTTLKRKISLVMGRFKQIVYGGINNNEKEEKISKSYNLNDVDGETKTYDYLTEKLGGLLKEQGVNIEDLQIEIKEGESQESGRDVHDTTDVKIYNKKDNELIYIDHLVDQYPSSSY